MVSQLWAAKSEQELYTYDMNQNFHRGEFKTYFLYKHSPNLRYDKLLTLS